jgi:hypothetical protein
MDTAITLICPGALAGRYEDAVSSLSPVDRGPVTRLLRRARIVSDDLSARDSGALATAAQAIDRETALEHLLRTEFGLPEASSVAAFEAVSERDLPTGWIVRLASFHVGLDHLVLLPGDALALSPAEAQQLLVASQEWLANEPVRLSARTAEVWELTELDPDLTRFDRMQGASSGQATGRNIDLWLPRGEAARRWRRLANELQMMWHEHPVNQARRACGLPVVNGLWFEGRTLPPQRRPFDLILSRSDLLCGLGRATGARVIRDGSTSALESVVCEVARSPATRCLIDPGLWPQYLSDESDAAWRQGWEQFGAWFRTFDAGFRPGHGGAIRWLLTGQDRCVALEVSPRALLRMWRDSMPLRWFGARAA